MVNTLEHKMGDGSKFDQDKPRWDLVPYSALEDMVKILTFGAKKYGDNNWKGLDNWENRYFSACMRHLVTWKNGERLDNESGLSHIAHALTNLLFILYLDNKSNIPATLCKEILGRYVSNPEEDLRKAAECINQLQSLFSTATDTTNKSVEYKYGVPPYVHQDVRPQLEQIADRVVEVSKPKMIYAHMG